MFNVISFKKFNKFKSFPIYFVLFPYSEMKNWIEASMTCAIEDVRKGMSVRKAFEKHGVPKSSLSDRLTGRGRVRYTLG